MTRHPSVVDAAPESKPGVFEVFWVALHVLCLLWGATIMWVGSISYQNLGFIYVVIGLAGLAKWWWTVYEYV